MFPFEWSFRARNDNLLRLCRKICSRLLYPCRVWDTSGGIHGNIWMFASYNHCDAVLQVLVYGTLPFWWAVFGHFVACIWIAYTIMWLLIHCFGEGDGLLLLEMNGKGRWPFALEVAYLHAMLLRLFILLHVPVSVLDARTYVWHTSI